MNQLRRMQAKGRVSSMVQITLMKEEVSVLVLKLTKEVEDVLKQFEDVFAEPKSLPPNHMLDHEIHLIPNSTPVSVRPYRYPHF